MELLLSAVLQVSLIPVRTIFLPERLQMGGAAVIQSRRQVCCSSLIWGKKYIWVHEKAKCGGVASCCDEDDEVEQHTRSLLIFLDWTAGVKVTTRFLRCLAAAFIRTTAPTITLL